MNNLLDLLRELSEKELPDNIEAIDVTNDEQYYKLVDQLKELKNDRLSQVVGSFFGINESFYDEVIELLADLREKELNKIENKQKQASVKCIEKDNSTEIDRPSQKIDTQVGLQIHRLVQEYIDTMIKPYNPNIGGLTNEQINDAYAGLYEFACWMYNK